MFLAKITLQKPVYRSIFEGKIDLLKILKVWDALEIFTLPHMK